MMSFYILRFNVIFLILTCQSSSLRAQAVRPGLPFIRNFSTLDYKAGIQNWNITQDKRGLLYIANNFGLLEYDGSQWATYPVKNGTKVRSVATDGRGRLYVGGQGDFGYFFPDHKGQLQYHSLADSLKASDRNFDEAWSVYIDQGKVYFCTFSAIYVYDKQKFTVVRPPNGIDHSYFVNRQLFVNQPLFGLGTLRDDKIQVIAGGEFFKGKSVSAVLPLHQSDLLVATFQDGIFEYHEGNLEPWNSALQSFLKESIVNCMIRLRNGSFAIGTQNNGLLVVDGDGKLQLQLTRGKGIETRTVLSIHEDDLQNVWLGQNNGISYIELGSPFTFINEQIGLPGSGYAALLEKNTLYLGTNTGVYAQAEHDGSYQLIDGTSGQVYSIGKYGNDLLVGHHNGTFRIEGTSSTKISNEPGSWTFLSLKENNKKLIGGIYGGLQAFDLREGHWKFDQKLNGFWESSRVMAQDAGGEVWITHGYKGAFKVKFNPALDKVDSVTFYGSEKGFPTNLLINAFPIRNELIFTSQGGLYKYDAKQDRFLPDDFLNKLLGHSNITSFMQEDAMGNIYFISQDKIGLLKKNAIGEYSVETNFFNKLRKYLNDDLLSIAVLKNNQVLYGGKDGFIHYDPFRALPNRSTFNTWIRRVSNDTLLFAGNYKQSDSLIQQQIDEYSPTLPYASNSLTFTFAANAYESANDIQYQYYLETYDKDWSAWTLQTQKEYTNLKEGRYVFHVRAKNINGEISKASTYSFTIKPPWYRSLWAYSFYGLSFLMVLFSGFGLIDRKYQKEQQLLEEKQRTELNQKETQLEKLSQESQEEINRLQHEKLQSELRHMNNELATSTMHLLNKNEFITSIKSSLDHLIKKSQHDDLKKELFQITRQIEQNISADADWEHFQLHFDRVHGDFSNRFKVAFPTLSPQEIKLSAYLRMNLSSKEIAQLLNISVRGVEISRYRLRKKLQLDRNKNLQEFILNF
jgi:DNA-binding CsgD family transcriptional regulator